MSVAELTASRWVCDGCGVCVSWIDGHRGPLPDAWVRSGDGCFCLKCRRDRAADSALATAPEDTSRDARAKLRRASLIEFEIRRTPDMANNQIARVCRSSTPAVAAVRRRIESRTQEPTGSG
jgi:hypothetical protein